MYGFARNHLGRIKIPQVVPSPVLQQVDWVPTDDKEAEEWAAMQAERWARPEIERLAGKAAQRVKKELSHDLQLALPMTEDETLGWVLDELTRNGVPQSPEDAKRLLGRFLDDQGVQMGLHPAFLAAADLLIDFPLDDPGQAAEWTLEIGSSIAGQYGIALPTDADAKSIVMASATAGLTHAGVPFAGAMTATATALFDGTVTQEEIRSLAGMVGSTVGATIGQMFGIPAPIGGFIGSVITTFIYDGLMSLFGWGPSASQKRTHAYLAAKAAAEAEKAQCMILGAQAWTEYQNYWYELERQLQQSINAESFWLQKGLRYFDDAYVERVEVPPEQCTTFSYEQLARFAKGEDVECYEQLPAIIDRGCKDAEGCLYFGKSPRPPGLWLRHDERGWFGQPGLTHPDATPDVEYRYVDVGAKINGKLSARAALLFYGAYEFVTPYQAYRTFTLLESYRAGTSQRSLLAAGASERVGTGRRVRDFEATLQTDRRYIEALSRVPIVEPENLSARKVDSTVEWFQNGKPIESDRVIDGRFVLEECDTQRWAAQLFESLLQCGPASALVSRDISATISAAMVEYKIAAASEQQTVQQQAAQAAQTRKDLLALRREKARRSRALNGGLVAAGGGALAGWTLSSILKGK